MTVTTVLAPEDLGRPPPDFKQRHHTSTVADASLYGASGGEVTAVIIPNWNLKSALMTQESRRLPVHCQRM